MASGDVTVRLRILGRVQGVGYRAWTVHTASKLGLRGWVRNLTDGSVEAVACGAVTAIERLVAAAQAGPSFARVTEVRSTKLETSDAAALALPNDFRAAATAAPEKD